MSPSLPYCVRAIDFASNQIADILVLVFWYTIIYIYLVGCCSISDLFGKEKLILRKAFENYNIASKSC